VVGLGGGERCLVTEPGVVGPRRGSKSARVSRGWKNEKNTGDYSGHGQADFRGRLCDPSASYLPTLSGWWSRGQGQMAGRSAILELSSVREKDSKNKVRWRQITEEEIEARRTARGGWTKAQLEEWGIQWIGDNPPKGWKKWILKNGIPYRGKERR
jgi:hypothetical protein